MIWDQVFIFDRKNAAAFVCSGILCISQVSPVDTSGVWSVRNLPPQSPIYPIHILALFADIASIFLQIPKKMLQQSPKLPFLILFTLEMEFCPRILALPADLW